MDEEPGGAPQYDMIANIQRKLGARNRVGIAVWAWDNGHVRS